MNFDILKDQLQQEVIQDTAATTPIQDNES